MNRNELEKIIRSAELEEMESIMKIADSFRNEKGSIGFDTPGEELASFHVEVCSALLSSVSRITIKILERSGVLQLDG